MERGWEQRWLLGSYPRLHRAYRIACRTRIAFMDPTANPWRRVAQVPLLVRDLAAVEWLAIPDRPARLGRRVAMDAVEVAVAAATDGVGHSQINTVIPLAAEAGLRHGAPAAVGVPALQLAVAVATARARGRRAATLPFMWPLAGGLAGVALARAERRRSAQLAARHRVELSAKCRRADLAGEHGVAMGHDTLIDALGNIHWLLSTGGANPYWDHKRRLAEAARTEATYLADAVMRWARDHNAAGPDLAADVVVTVARGGSETLLTDAQVTELRTGLDDLHLTGEVLVEGPAAHVSGRSAVINVTSAAVTAGLRITADRTAPVVPLDPTPVPLAMMVPWLWLCTLGEFDAVPKARAIPSTAAAAATATVLAVYHRRTGNAISRPALIASIVVGTLHVALTTPSVGNAHTAEGYQPHPVVGALYAPLVILGLEDDKLTASGRVAARAALAAMVVLSLVLYPHRPDPRAMTGVLDVFVAFNAASGWGASLGAQARDVAAEVEQGVAAALDEAFERGRDRVLDSISGGIDDARRRIAADGPRLDPGLLEAISARLGDVERGLVLARAEGDPSATRASP